jgi:hypothetical protein
MLTTITVNGPEGLRFLSLLQETSTRERRSVPPALAAMIEHVTSAASHESSSTFARGRGAARGRDRRVHRGRLGGQGIALFSAQVGDPVVLVRGAGRDLGRQAARAGRQYLPAGTVGRLVGRKGDLGKLLLLEGKGGRFPEREHAYVSDRCTTRKLPR